MRHLDFVDGRASDESVGEVPLERDAFHQFHHIEEVGFGILQVVHDTLLAIVSEDRFQHGHFIDQGFAYFRTVVFDEGALDAECLSLEGTNLGLGVSGNLSGGVGHAESHDVDLVLVVEHGAIRTYARLIAFDGSQIECTCTLQKFKYFFRCFHNCHCLWFVYLLVLLRFEQNGQSVGFFTNERTVQRYDY